MGLNSKHLKWFVEPQRTWLYICISLISWTQQCSYSSVWPLFSRGALSLSASPPLSWISNISCLYKPPSPLTLCPYAPVVLNTERGQCTAQVGHLVFHLTHQFEGSDKVLFVTVSLLGLNTICMITHHSDSVQREAPFFLFVRHIALDL